MYLHELRVVNLDISSRIEEYVMYQLNCSVESYVTPTKLGSSYVESPCAVSESRCCCFWHQLLTFPHSLLRYTVLLNNPNMFRNIFLVHGKLLLDNSTVRVLCYLYLSSLLNVQVFLSKFKQQLWKATVSSVMSADMEVSGTSLYSSFGGGWSMFIDMLWFALA